MNLNDLVDGNTTTRKMRAAVKRDDTAKEIKRLSKRKNSNSNERSVQPMDGPGQGDDVAEANPEQMQFDAQ